MRSRLIYFVIIAALLISGVDLKANDYAPFQNTLPPGQLKQQIHQVGANSTLRDWWDDGPSGNGNGGGGAIGRNTDVPIGDIGAIHLLVILLLYIVFKKVFMLNHRKR